MAKKTLYHSELVQFGAVEVTIKSDRKQSKYQGKPDYYAIQIDGEERLYNTENEDCAVALEGLNGQTVIIEASGDRDNAQIIVSEAVGGQQQPPPRQPARQPARQPQAQPARNTPPANRQPARQPAQTRQPARQPVAAPQTRQPAPATQGAPDLRRVRLFFGRAANGMLLALNAANYIKRQFEAEHAEQIKAGTVKPLTDEHERAIASSLFIAADKNGQLNWLPEGPMSKAQAPAPKAAQPSTRSEQGSSRAEEPQADAPEPEPEPEPPKMEKCPKCQSEKFVDGPCPQCDDVPF